MKKLFLFLMFLFLIAGWALAAASLHVVRTDGRIPKIGAIHLVPKDRLTYRETWMDVTTWTDEQLAAHPSLGHKFSKQPRPAGDEARRVEAGTFSLLSR